MHRETRVTHRPLRAVGRFLLTAGMVVAGLPVSLGPPAATAATEPPILSRIDVKRWPVSPINYGLATAVDGRGIRYVLRDTSTDPALSTFRLERIETSGTTAWEVPVNLAGPENPRLEWDVKGNLYLSGRSGRDGEIAVMRMDPEDGGVVWRKTFGGLDARIPASISLDSSRESLFFAANYGSFARILRLSAADGSDEIVADTASSVQPGTRRLNVYDISAEATGCLYAVGHVDGVVTGTGAQPEKYGQYAVLKYGYDGVLQWAKQSYTAEEYSNLLAAPVAHRVAVDPRTGEASVLVNQYPRIQLQVASWGSRWYLLKFSPRGHMWWSRSVAERAGSRDGLALPEESVFADPGTAQLAVDAGGRTYVAVADLGEWKNTPSGPAYTVVPYLKVFARDGERSVLISDNGLTVEHLTASGGYVYVTGSTRYPLDGPIGESTDFGAYVAKYRGMDVDTDGDGLPDRWEIEGYRDPTFNNFVDLPKMGADPLHKDIFVEIDYMGAGDGRPEFRPTNAAIGRVVRAFANADQVKNPDGTTGIDLHVDNGDASVMNAETGATWGDLSEQSRLAHKTYMEFPSDFRAYKGNPPSEPGNLRPERRPIFHYCIWADQRPNGSSGVSDGIGASDFLVTLGNFTPAGGTELQQAGTFMHELGHNLGLRHGGLDDLNYKPNYLSVMSYTYQFDGLSKLTGGVDTRGILDYSRFGSEDISNVNERSLDESTGMTSPNGNPVLSDYLAWHYATLNSYEESPAIGPRDWDGDSRIETGTVWWNVNFGCGDPARPETWGSTTYDDVDVSYNDWENIFFKGGLIGDGAWGLPDVLPAKPFVDTADPSLQPAPPYAVAISAPADVGLTPGSSLTRTFTIKNTGSRDDTYTVEASSSDGWASLAEVPTEIGLAAGAQRAIQIPVTVPFGSDPGRHEKITIAATSIEHNLISDEARTIVAASKVPAFGPEVFATRSKPVYTVDQGYVYEMPSGWIVSRISRYDPSVRAWENVPFTPSHYIYPSTSQGYGTSPFGNVSNVSNGRIVYTMGNDYSVAYWSTSRRWYLGVYDLATQTERLANVTDTHAITFTAISGDTVIYNEKWWNSAVSDYTERRWAWDLSSDTYTMLAERLTAADPALPEILDLDGSRVAWVSYSPNTIHILDVATDEHTQIPAPGARHARLSGDNLVYWDMSTPPVPTVHHYDLQTGLDRVIGAQPTASGTAGTDAELSIDGDLVLWSQGPIDHQDLIVYDLEKDARLKVATAESYLYDHGTSPFIDDGASIGGNVITYSRRQTGGSYYDSSLVVLPTESLPPSTTVSVTPASPDADGWYSTTPTVTLAADMLNTATYYQFDATRTAGWVEYLEPFPVPEGDHTLYYYSADPVGNTEPAKSMSIRVDTTAPETTIEATGGAMTLGTGIYSSAPTISLVSSEPGDSFYQWDATATAGWTGYDSAFPAPEGSHTLYAYSADPHGNAGEPRGVRFVVDVTPDSTAPAVTVDATPSAEPDGIFTSRPRIALSADETATIHFQWDSTSGFDDPPSMPLLVRKPLAPGEPPQYYGGDGWSTYVGPLYSEEGRHTLYYYAIDVAGNRSEIDSITIEVAFPEPTGNAAPVLDPIGDLTVAEGSTLAFQVVGADEDGDPLTYSVSGLPEGATFDEATGAFDWTPTFAQSGSYTMTFTASDGTLSGSEDARVWVTDVNRPPTASEVSVTTAQGVATAVRLEASDPDGDLLTWLLAVPPLHGVVLGTAPDLLYVPDAGFAGMDGFRFVVDDGRGGTTGAGATIRVAAGNTAPEITELLFPSSPVAVDTPVTGVVHFTDSDTDDSWTAVFSWGDGTVSTGTVDVSADPRSATATHTYSTPGVYQVGVEVSDGVAEDYESVPFYLVVFDPNGSFVTGGGSIVSPAGAYTVDPSLGGKATFGFVSKYVKGATAPTGHTEFQFHAASMTFRSKSYDWLVIAGARAQYKGSGTLDDGTVCGFLLTAVDGQMTGGGGVDRFRIKIWDRATGEVVYDNQIGTTDGAELGAPTALTGGSIVVHKR